MRLGNGVTIQCYCIVTEAELEETGGVSQYTRVYCG